MSIIQNVEIENFFAIATYGDNEKIGRNLFFLDEDGYQYRVPIEIPKDKIKGALQTLRKKCYQNWDIFSVKIQEFRRVIKN